MKKKGLFFVCMSVCGTLVAYPIFHELGHVIAAIANRVSLVGFSLTPMPSVLCDIAEKKTDCMIGIGLNGLGLPVVVSCFCQWKNVPFWFGTLFFRVVSGAMVLLSILSSVAFVCGNVSFHDDISVILSKNPAWFSECMAVMCILLLMIVISIYRSDPAKKFIDFINLF